MTEGAGGADFSTIVDGRYRVLSRIGSGGMADVLCAEDLQLGRKVALKLLHRRFAADAEFVERFRREASSAAGLQHPNVVAVYDRGRWDDTYYIAMEYLEGRTLKKVVTEEAPLAPHRAIELVAQILKAARFAHARGIVHRDLKPHNVIVGADGRAKVTDFGIAKAGASDMTQTGSIMGTAQYLSPEQAQGHAVSGQSDLYSIGIILYELLTGRVPFEGESAVTIALKQVNEAPVPPSHYNPAIPPALEAVVLRALEKDPARRFADADAFIAALEAAELAPVGDATQVIHGAVIPAAWVGPPSPPLPTPEAIAAYREHEGGAPPPGDGDDEGGGSRWWLALLVGLVVAGLVVGGLLLFGPKKVTVPSVVGSPQAEAQLALKKQGFDTSVIPHESLTKPKGQVIGQDPAGGSRARKGSTVDLFVSTGPGTATIPDLTGKPRSVARKTLGDLGLRIVEERQDSDTVGQNRVIQTRPAAGTTVDKGTSVTLVLSSGKARIKVPDVTGRNDEDARGELDALGFTVTVKKVENADKDPGTVLSQDPAGGTTLTQGATVTLTVAKAPPKVDVPDVTGHSEKFATDALKRAGFRVSVTDADVQTPDADGQVQSQSPGGGGQAKKGSTVTITVGRFNPALNPEGAGTPTTPTTPPTTTPGASG